MPEQNTIPKDLQAQDHLVQVSRDRTTVWVHTSDGSTVGRFSKRFGIDVHTTIRQQMEGANQCLHCTHQKPTREDWATFCELMQEHYQIHIPKNLIEMASPQQVGSEHD